jgi:hypothetical protein
VDQPLYYRLDRADSFTSEYIAGAEIRKRAEWTTLFTGLLEAAMPLCCIPQERRFFQQTILDRIVAYPNFRSSDEPNSSAKLIAECLERLNYEGNTHLLKAEELPPILQELQRRLDEIKLSERSRTQKGIYQIRQRYRIGKVIYPTSLTRRVTYQLRYLLEMLAKGGTRLLAKKNWRRRPGNELG